MLKRFDFSNFRTRLIFLTVLMAGVVASMILVYIQSQNEEPATPQPSSQTVVELKTPVEPQLITSEVATGLSHPWDIAFLPDCAMLYNERDGKITLLSEGVKRTVIQIADVYAVGEGGLTGLTLDSDFKNNRYIYTCFNAQTASGLDVRLVRWKLSADNTSLSDRKDIVTGIPSNVSGRHSGCRVRTSLDGNVWVGTGDAARATNPQDPKNLGGKILHITRDGMPAPGNLPAPYDPRIFSFGHRNVQGLVLFEKPIDGVYGYSIEHGSDRDDEINLLKSGNFGWAPRVNYVESAVAMTDTVRFPSAVTAVWSSGSPTIAPSGATQLKGEKWGTWNGAVAMAVLKGKHVRIIKFSPSSQVVQEKAILQDFGRIRSTALGADGNMYISTDNGSNDKIIRITPTGN